MRIICYNCNGTGRTPFAHIANGICFRCDGKGGHPATQEEISAHREKLTELTLKLDASREKYEALDTEFTETLETAGELLSQGISEADRKNLVDKLTMAAEESEDVKSEIERIERSIAKEKASVIYPEAR